MKNILPSSINTLRLLHTGRRKPITLCHQCYRRLATGSKVFEVPPEGDIVLLRQKADLSHDGILTKPLRPSTTVHTHRGPLSHSNIIGKSSRDVVKTTKGYEYRVLEPTLSEYIRYTPRLVTPIYPHDANLIVSFLDIHVSPPTESSIREPPLEILEAGTGHGALTLHLSRAIHAANPAIPSVQPPPPPNEDELEDPVYQGDSVADLQDSDLAAWTQKRRAIIHTLDINPETSAHARQVVRRFRRGIYAGNVDFHVGDVSAWVASQADSRKTSEPFLSHVFLDLPNPNHHIANIATALRVDGILAVFNPSVTQIVECVDMIRNQKLPYILDQVVELGENATVRQWDVRAVKPRAVVKRENEARNASESLASNSDETPSGENKPGEAEVVGGMAARDRELAEDLSKSKSEWAMICRPKVGEKIVGGGFLGIWRRMKSVVPGNEDT
ncbi:S-adenosyl-L-methionine-dependent methyltransferase [Lepidopterella palustris CBS 459.81]|uniref:tRNA (adenine(58)-N(1))-methyltransferase catalytic subunit TRM61 n=1 Tax=Lepidopterella palustris CBS 459.81 TaxID=1314670 RepID=A0A8E2JGI6_9PEZI|nr:S-adenosyl-L-methionine-dependent methyltransferase [Lepidopterella palustris CBS 459.81]